MKKNIKNLIFDLGGVFIDIDYARSFEAMNQLSGVDVHQKIKEEAVQNHFDRYEMGLMSDGDFRAGVREFFRMEVGDVAFDQAWNAMLGGIPESRVDHLLALRKNYPSYLLSNTNNIHIKYVLKVLQDSTNYSNFDQLFDKVYYSHQVNMRKPNQDIYQFVLEENNLEGSESIFFDDTQLNLTGAAATGLHTYHVLSPEQMFKDITSGRL